MRVCPFRQRGTKQKSPVTSRRIPGFKEKKKPGALSRSGPGAVSASALAFLRFRTCAVLAEFAAILYEALPARWQGYASRIHQFDSVFHVFLNARGREFCTRDFSMSTGKKENRRNRFRRVLSAQVRPFAQSTSAAAAPVLLARPGRCAPSPADIPLVPTRHLAPVLLCVLCVTVVRKPQKTACPKMASSPSR